MLSLATAIRNLRNHPPALFFLFFTEMAERFSFYTMKSLLVLYMTRHFGLSDEAAGQVYGIFGLLVWFTPVFGGHIADRRLGVVKTVFWGGVVFFFGHLLLGATDLVGGSPTFLSPSFLVFAFGLLVVACGNGLFKGNISVLVGALYETPERKPLRDDAFQIFYVGINLGAFAAPIAAPAIRDSLGWGAAFGSAALGIILSFTVFALGRRRYADRAPARTPAGAAASHPLTPKQKTQLGAVFVILAVSAVFWSVFFQDAYKLTLFAERHVDLDAWGWRAENFLSFNPLFIFIFSPFIVLFWSFLRERKREPSTPGKMVIGCYFMAAAMLVFFIAARHADSIPGGRITPWYMALAYALHTLGELCLSPLGLSFVSRYAPPGRSGLLMGCWFGSIAVGNYATGALGALRISFPTFFLILMGIMIAAGTALLIVLRRVERALD